MKTSSKLWIGLGTVIAAGAGVAADGLAETSAAPALHVSGSFDIAQHAHGAPVKVTPAKGQGGEGGEGGEGGKADALAPNLTFARSIALIRGHLLVGDELVKDGRFGEALPHFLHPAEEIYGGIKNDLATYKIRPFEAALKALAQTVKARKKDAYDGALKLVQERLAEADAGLREAEKNWPRFSVETALETLKVAADEYGNAIEKGRIAKAVEYQDSRGFVWHSAAMIDAVTSELAAKDAAAFKELQAALVELKKAWPTAVAPKRPVKDTSAVLGDIARVELQAGNFLR
ncbi:hypothetical protein AB4099_19310 [Bosea sp. 2KB_26]|uniref:hypothetical protein n=1 Tax=Bosea sp. 2KB_26 TaxID=3237475 RepID=UPI003F8E8994